MTIYKTAEFQVNPQAVEKCKQAIDRFTSILYPELVGGPVHFTAHTLVATNHPFGTSDSVDRLREDRAR